MYPLIAYIQLVGSNSNGVHVLLSLVLLDSLIYIFFFFHFSHLTINLFFLNLDMF